MISNVPDDYHVYWYRCPHCQMMKHPAEQPTCACDELEDDELDDADEDVIQLREAS